MLHELKQEAVKAQYLVSPFPNLLASVRSTGYLKHLSNHITTQLKYDEFLVSTEYSSNSKPHQPLQLCSALNLFSPTLQALIFLDQSFSFTAFFPFAIRVHDLSPASISTHCHFNCTSHFNSAQILSIQSHRNIQKQRSKQNLFVF